MTETRTTPLGLLHYAHSYATAAKMLAATDVGSIHPDAPVRFLYRHAIELYLKAFLLFHGEPLNELRRSFGHSITMLARRATELGLILSDIRKPQMELLEDALADRYIETGSRTVLESSVMLEICGDLQEQIAPRIYEANGLRRRLVRP